MATARERFLQAYAELANSVPSARPASSYVAPELNFTMPTRRNLTGGAYTPLNIEDFAGGGSKQENPGDPLWMDALQFIGRPGNAFFGMLDEASDGKKSSFGSVAGRAWGGLKGKDENVGASTVMNNLGWTEMKMPKNATMWDTIKTQLNNSSREVAGLVGDVALDPLNLFTLGAGSVAKTGVQAAKSSMKSVAKDLGSKIGSTTDRSAFKVGKNVEETVGNIYQGTLQRTGSTRLAERTAEMANQRISSAMQSAREVSQNRLVNIDIPFTTLVKGFGRKPAAISKGFAKVDDAGRVVADDMLTTMGLTDPVRRKTFLQRTVGVDSVDKLDTAMLTHLSDGFSKLEQTRTSRLANDGQLKQPAVDVTQTTVRPEVPVQSVEDLITRGYDPTPPDATGVRTDATVGRTDENVDQFYRQGDVADSRIGQYVADSGGRSPVSRAYLGTALGKMFDRRPNVAAGALMDAETAIAGGRRMAEYDLRNLEKAMSGMTDLQRQEVAHVVEGTQRASSPEVQAAADEAKAQLGMMRDAEVGAGVLQNTRRGYFPHVLTDQAKGFDQARFDELKSSDPEFAALLGKSQGNNFNKSRETFQTLAQVDNYMNKLNDRIRAATDPDEIADLSDKLSAVENLFERDAVRALQKRAHKSVSSRVMKKTYDDLAKNGLIYAPKNMTPRASGADFVRLDAKQAGTLGLEQGTMVHKDVMQGLDRVRELFNDDNMNRVLKTGEAVMGVWKSIVTNLNPSHHIFNLVGNVSNNMMAGVGVKAYSKAGGILQRLRSGKLSAKDREIVSEALEKGVLFAGDTSEFVKSLRDSLKYPVEGVPIIGNYSKFMRKFGESLDNFSRLAHYIDKRAAYNNIDQAANSVRTYLFNYREMTTADRFARLTFPFWNWTRNNIPLQLEKLFQTPRYANAYMNLQQSLQDKAREEGPVPSWMEDKGIFIPGMDKMYNPRLPLTDLSNLDNPFKMFTDMLSPAIKIPSEISSNTSFFNGKPIDWERFAGKGTDPKAWVDYGLQQTGAIGKAINLANPTTTDNFGEKLLQMFTGRPADITEGG